MSEFAHLHLHTEFSLLDGMGRIHEYIARAKATGLHHLAVTDHGVMYGAMDWYTEASKAGLHPIIGMEAYLSESPVAQRERKSYHLLLLAENEDGYRNLLKLATRSNLEGFYYRPRIDLEMLAEHSEGLIGTSACLGGPVANNFLHDRPERAREYAGKLSEIFAPGRFFIEIQDHGLKEQISTNRQLIPLARELNLPLVATNDVHYCEQAHAPGQELLVCVQTNTTLSDPKRLRTESDQLYLKDAAAMARVFGEVPEALSNTIRIAEMCDLKLEFSGYHMPHFDVPGGKSPDAYLEELCREGAIRKYGHVEGVVADRLAYELGVIRDMGFTNYFLVVWDFVRFARESGILVGPGRGSAAGSLVTYALDVTALDPLRYDLIFERFLNPARISMPDIDIDFADDRRDEVIEYVVKKYGDDRVAQIVTFGTMAAKAAVRDVGRAMGLSFGETDRVAKLIPVGPGITIDGAMSRVPELHKLYDDDAQVRTLIDSAKGVEGIARHSSTHAAGVVISRDPLVDHVPLQRAGGKSEGDITTQYPMGQLEALGLLKMDFLGLKTLTVLGKATDLVRREGVDLTLEDMPLDDPKAYELLRRGETVGIFQLEGAMTTRMTIDVAPSSFEDLIALMALIRPGPMEMAPDYISRKHGRTPIEYMHPELESVLSETYGVALYQEQVMRIANTLAGFSMAEGDGLRKAMGKKLPAEMAKYRDRFVQGCVDHGLSKPLAVDIYDMIERFAGYGFNKAHSAAYAMIAAQTAYLKANHPVEFMAALLSTDIGATEKVVSNLVECRRAGIPVLPPCINASELEFSVERAQDGRKAVRFGLLAVKN
ncbi:MAG TPA: DNA polymerase III subunit alpha, partial [Thermomicrobiales bacterium]|nr:DNA polymerase III subunit alpha [Thermomicrobiales bacterium]